MARFRGWTSFGGPDLVAETISLVAVLGLDPANPTTRASVAIAAATASWVGYPYHSGPTHHAEVATCASVLALRSEQCGWPLDSNDRAILLCAALGHDIGFDPMPPRRPFHLESLAAKQISAIAARCGCSASEREEMALITLATEPSARATLRALVAGETADVPTELNGLRQDGRLARLGAILSDADLIPSAGLNIGWSEEMGRRLAAETGRIADPIGFARFLDNVVGTNFISAPGREFDPNLAKIRAWATTGCGHHGSTVSSDPHANPLP